MEHTPKFLRFAKRTPLLALALVVVSFGGALAATMTNNTWQADGGVFSGSVTDAAHWDKGHAPCTLERMLIWNNDANYTLLFPEGLYTNSAALRLAPKSGRTVTLDGTHTTWVMPGPEDGTTAIYDTGLPFALYPFFSGKNYGSPSFGFVTSGLNGMSTTEYATHPVAELGDFWIFIDGSPSDPTVVFDGGTYNFRDPCGQEWTATKKPLLMLGGGDGQSTGTYGIVFKNGVNLSAWDVGIQAAGQKGGNVLFDGGNYYFQALNMPDGNRDYANQYANVSETTLTNGAVMSVASIFIGHRSNKEVNLHLHGTGTVFEVRGGVNAPCERLTAIDVLDGATFRMGSGTLLSGAGTNYTRVVNAEMTSLGNLYIGNTSKETAAATACAILAVTNGTLSVPAALHIENSGHMIVSGPESRVAVGSMSNYDSSKFACSHPTLTLDGGEMTVSNNLFVATYGTFDMTVLDGTFTAGRYVELGRASGADVTLTVAGGLFNNQFTKAQSIAEEPVYTCTYLGVGSTTSKGTLNVTGGEARFISLFSGWNGRGEINVSGGRLWISIALRVGNAALADYEHPFTQTGGEVYMPINAEIGQTANAKARIKLNGGVCKTYTLTAGDASPLKNSSSTTGNVAFEADGGTLVALANSTSADPAFMRYFNSAEIKAGGLTIDTASHTIGMNQTFTGTGTLSLMGGGSVSFTNGNAIEGPVRVVGDTTIAFNGAVPGALTLGDAASEARMTYAAGSPVHVDGDLTISNLALTVSGVTVGTTLDVFTAAGSLGAGTAELWDALAVAGLPESAACDPEIVQEGGLWHLRLVVREPKDIPIDVPADTLDTHATNITWRRSDRLVVNAESGGEARLEGVLGHGWLVKEGLGTLTLANPIHEIYDGVKFVLGTINLDYPTDNAVADWRLLLAAENSSDTLRFTSTRPVSVDCLDAAAANAARGSLTVASASQVCFTLSTRNWCPIDGALKVEEGEMKIRCPDTTTGYFGPSSVTVGIGGTGGSRSKRAVLTIDNLQASGGVSLGCGLDESAQVVDCRLVLTNGTKYLSSGRIFNNDCKNTNAVISILLDNSTIGALWEYNMYGVVNVPPKVTARNGSFITDAILSRGDVDFLFDASTLGTASKATRIIYYANWTFAQNVTFQNGSVCHISAVQCGAAYAYLHPPNVNLTFDDSEFRGMNGDFGHHTPPTSGTVKGPNPTVQVYARGTGVKVNVPEGETYTWSYPLWDSADGAGGFVKQGAGTLTVTKVRNPDLSTSDEFAFRQTGVTVVEDGVLDLDGNTWTGASFGGGEGTVSNVVLRAARLVPTISGGTALAVPRFSEDCSFAGLTSVDFSAAGLPTGRTLPVARYEGTAPDVSKWRLVNNAEKTRGMFKAEGGTVYVTVVNTLGFVLVYH